MHVFGKILQLAVRAKHFLSVNEVDSRENCPDKL